MTKKVKESWQSKADEIGQIAELNVNAELRKFGRVLVPFGGTAPYDVVLETKTGNFIKCQTKHAKINYGVDGHISVTFRTTDRNGNKYSNDDVHCFAVYSSQLNKTWIVPFGWCGDKTRQTLTITTGRCGAGSLPADDFTPESQLTHL